MRRYLFVVAGCGLLAAGLGRAQTPQPSAAPSPRPAPAPACTTAAHRQFDFWIGNWDVTSKGRPAGVNRVTLELGNCAIHEHWEGVSGLRGESLNVYDAARGRWHQTWVDSRGTLLALEGGLENGSMVLAGERPGETEGSVQLQRITWTPLARDSVRQLWEVSDDRGKSWGVAFDGLYVRRPSKRGE